MCQNNGTKKQVIEICDTAFEKSFLTCIGGNVSVRFSSRIYPSMADNNQVIDDVLERFEFVLRNVEGVYGLINPAGHPKPVS